MFEMKLDKFQYFADEWNADAVENRSADNKIVNDIDGRSASTINTRDVDVNPIPTYATPCIACGELIEISIYDGGSKLCPSCKKAIQLIKEKFAAELKFF